VMWLMFLSRMWSGSIRSPQWCESYYKAALSYQDKALWEILRPKYYTVGVIELLAYPEVWSKHSKPA
jgi:hypothetical protein